MRGSSLTWADEAGEVAIAVTGTTTSPDADVDVEVDDVDMTAGVKITISGFEGSDQLTISTVDE